MFGSSAGPVGAALSAIAAGVRGGEPCAVLTGEEGAGKSNICRGLLQELRRDCGGALIDDPAESAVDMLRSMLWQLGINARESSGESDEGERLTWKLNQFLAEMHRENRRVVVVIDDADQLSVEMLQWLCALGSDKEGRRKVLQLVLVGHTRMLHTLRHAPLPDYMHRTANWYRLPTPPMPKAEPEPVLPQPASHAPVQPSVTSPVALLQQRWQRAVAATAIIAIAIGAASFGVIGDRLQVTQGKAIPSVAAIPQDARPVTAESSARSMTDDVNTAPIMMVQLAEENHPQPHAAMESPTIETELNALPSLPPLQPVVQAPKAETKSEPAASSSSAIAVSVKRDPAAASVSGEVADDTPPLRIAERAPQTATVDEAWKLFENLTDPVAPGASSIVPVAKASEPVRAQAPAAGPGSSWALSVGSYESRDEAEQAARSAAFHLRRVGGAAHAGAFVADQPDERNGQRFVALVGGLHDGDEAQALAKAADQFGYRSQVVAIDVAQGESSGSHE